VSWQGLRAEQSFLTTPQQSAEGIVGTQERVLKAWNGGEEAWPDVER
jgi:hypothetical protein